MPIDLDKLNEAQREAVLTTEGPLLVLAGAGSGKTRVLTYRIANLLENHGVDPWEILAITFTNKAANEMRERLGSLVGSRVRGMWVSTFHSMCVRILRDNAERLGFTSNFTIYDDNDSKLLYREIIDEMDLDSARFSCNMLSNRISQAKNELIVPEDFAEQARNPIDKVVARVYTRMQERLRAANAFDFDDLLLYTYLLFKHHDDVLAAYQDRFRYILVDEYQDTNHAQYMITMMLASAHRNIMVVGDDDQSIYSWRGADIRNILEFENDFPEAHVVKLEQNYRSVGNILEAANAVIANNQQRKEKRLFTTSDKGSRIEVYTATDERDEGRWIAGEIEREHTHGIDYDSIAVFYRTNAQSRMLEDMFLRAGVPYRIVGGTRFFDRAEIRDVMAYLTLAVNPADDLAAKRVINVPRRGIGKVTCERIEQVARELDMPFAEAAETLIAENDVRASMRKAVGEFTEILKEIRTFRGDLRDVVEMIIERTGIVAALEAEHTNEAQTRIENIQELMGVVDEFAETHNDDEAMYAAPTVSDEGYSGVVGDDSDTVGAAGVAGVDDGAPAPAADREPVRVLRGDSLADFVEWVSLRTDLDTMAEGGHAVTLMTVHAAKGLEFDYVFVSGMEESVFPHGKSIDDKLLEEERRLAYVAITRARERLYLTCAQRRQLYGETKCNPVSRFVTEIPGELRQSSGVGSAGFEGTGWEKRGSRRGIAGSGTRIGEGHVFGYSGGRAMSSYTDHDKTHAASRGRDAGVKPAAKMSFAVGDTVDHKTFGRGEVVKVDGDMIHVRFVKSNQTKKLLKAYAPIVKIDG